MNKKGSIWILIGTLLISTGLGILAYNFYSSIEAGKHSKLAAEQLIETIPNDSATSSMNDVEVYPDYVLNPNMDMPTRDIDGYSYIGLLEIPALNLTLPVQQDWSDSKMKISPCRYTGSAYLSNMVICAHNSSAHFGKLKNLSEGDAIYFTDIDGNQFSYEVIETEMLLPDAVEEMVSGEWDLTLFTCTIGGAYRVTVRCVKSID